MRKLDYAPRLFFARSAGDPRLMGLVGQDAEFALGTREVRPEAQDARKRAVRGGLRREVVRAAELRRGAGLCGRHGARRGGAADRSLDQAKLRSTLAQMEIDTVLGGYKVDLETGEQRATRPAVVQIQRGKPEVVWPEWLQSSTVQPYPQWSERRVLE